MSPSSPGPPRALRASRSANVGSAPARPSVGPTTGAHARDENDDAPWPVSADVAMICHSPAQPAAKERGGGRSVGRSTASERKEAHARSFRSVNLRVRPTRRQQASVHARQTLADFRGRAWREGGRKGEGDAREPLRDLAGRHAPLDVLLVGHDEHERLLERLFRAAPTHARSSALARRAERAKGRKGRRKEGREERRQTHLCPEHLAQLLAHEREPCAVRRVDDEDDAPRARKVLGPRLAERRLAACRGGRRARFSGLRLELAGEEEMRDVPMSLRSSGTAD